MFVYYNYLSFLLDNIFGKIFAFIICSCPPGVFMSEANLRGRLSLIGLDYGLLLIYKNVTLYRGNWKSK